MSIDAALSRWSDRHSLHRPLRYRCPGSRECASLCGRTVGDGGLLGRAKPVSGPRPDQHSHSARACRYGRSWCVRGRGWEDVEYDDHQRAVSGTSVHGSELYAGAVAARRSHAGRSRQILLHTPFARSAGRRCRNRVRRVGRRWVVHLRRTPLPLNSAVRLFPRRKFHPSLRPVNQGSLITPMKQVSHSRPVWFRVHECFHGCLGGPTRDGPERTPAIPQQ